MSLHYRIEGLRHRYGDRQVLDLPDLAIERGEILALVGPSGAGKSTLLRLLALLEAPSQGRLELIVGERRVTSLTAALDDRRQIGMLFQRPILLSRSVHDNVVYGLSLRGERDSGRVEGALRQVGLDHLAGADPRTLSGGEHQRVALARALILRPQVLLLDEPTASLDPANVRIIEALISADNRERGTTVVLVTHNIFQARRLADRVGLLLDGELVELAPTRQFFGSPADPRTAAFTSGDFAY